MLLRRFTQGLLLLDIAICLVVVAVMCVLRASGDQLLSVQSDSMKPVFQTGDAVLSSPNQVQSIVTGEIVSYHNPKDPAVIISHRIVSLDAQSHQAITAGDALGSRDPPISTTLITGRVFAVLPRLGKLLDIIRRPFVPLVVLYMPAAILLYAEISGLIRQLHKPDYQLQARR